MAEYRITDDGSADALGDTRRFISQLDNSFSIVREVWPDFLRGPDDVFITRAPGRLDVMGGIADYSGSLVLQLPIGNAAHVALQRNKSTVMTIVSLPSDVEGKPRYFQMQIEELTSNGAPISYEKSRQRFAPRTSDFWAAYVVGALLVLMHENVSNF